MRNSVVTVFGGTGFIGRHLINRLARQGCEIRVATRDRGSASALQPMGNVGQIVPIVCDPRSEGSVRQLVAGATSVVNLVGILFESRKGDFQALQAELPGMIGRAAAATGVRRVVQISAIGADPDSASEYARTKAAGEAAVRAAFPDATILRPSVVFGPGDGFFTRFARMATVSPVLPLVGGGHTRFQPVFVGDVADAIVAALTREDAPGRTYELGGPRVQSLRELLEWMLKVLRRRRLLVTLPYGLASFQARFFELLPTPPLTRDQVELLKRDNVVSAGALTLADLGVSATPPEVIVPGYLRPFARWKTTAPVS
ncbi:MAG TPA: complex I NDUFA9 subunit family protein [Geminicoccaceae bacterium]|nr:complex I NDUFA9 subunit family protein [Geminicoccaceae bacterium]